MAEGGDVKDIPDINDGLGAGFAGDYNSSDPYGIGAHFPNDGHAGDGDIIHQLREPDDEDSRSGFFGATITYYWVRSYSSS
jgi:hypothetical protein